MDIKENYVIFFTSSKADVVFKEFIPVILSRCTKILFLLNAECAFPLGMTSGRIEDSQITASDHIGKMCFGFVRNKTNTEHQDD